MPDPLESFRLPHGYASSGDPIEKNPFPLDEPRHRVWRDATRTAEQEEARINVDFFACLERVKREQNAAEEAGGTIQDSLLLAAWARDKACRVSMVLAKFDAWAKRGTHVIWSDQQVEGNDRWLEFYANVWIDQVSNSYASNLPPREASELLLALRNALAARVHFWRAEARRYQSEQETQEPTSGHVSAEATKSSDSVSSAEPTGDSQARSSDFSWRDVTIRFTSENQVQTTIDGELQPAQNFEDLGFADRRKNTPNSAWQMLQTLAQRRGRLDLEAVSFGKRRPTSHRPGQTRERTQKGIQAVRASQTRDRTATQKRIQELRKTLCRFFNINADPIPFNREFGYETAFKLDPGTAFD